MLRPPDLDPKAVARQFDRRARRSERGEFLLREIESRMFDRLALVRLFPQTILDVGCGAGEGLRLLGKRFAPARRIGLDRSGERLRACAENLAVPAESLARRLVRWAGSAGAAKDPPPAPVWLVQADAARLPLAASSIDLLWSNLAWHWFEDPQAVAAEWYRVIRPNGLVMFSSFGVDTFRELRSLGAPIQEFPDMHDVGDLLMSAGFAEPVMDTERMEIAWTQPEKLLAEVRGLGGNASPGRAKGLQGRARRALWLDRLRALADSAGTIRLSVEVVHAHAWCGPAKRPPAGEAHIEWYPARPIRRQT